MNNDLATTAMWTDAVRDVDAESHKRAVAKATVALAGTWPFLAAAQSQEEFDHRLALMQEQIERSTPAQVLGEVTAQLKQRFAQLHESRLTSQLEARTAARKIAAPEGVQSLPQAYVHLHHHAAGGEDGSEYWQVDQVASPTAMRTLGHQGDRDTALQMAREAALPFGLPIFENGKHVEGAKLPLPAPGSEILDARTGRWVKVAHQIFRPGGGQAVPLSREQHERLNGNWGDSLSPAQAAYQPDPDAQWRYHYPDPPVAGAQGGQPTAPSPMGVGVVNQVGQTSVGPDGFPVDLAQGEDRSTEAIQYQITPGQWVAPPGGWPAATMPNAATGLPEGQRRSASKGQNSDKNGRPMVAASGPARECDIHKYEKGQGGVPAKYDGKTVYGPWANMCEGCAKTHGVDEPGGPLLRPLAALRMAAWPGDAFDGGGEYYDRSTSDDFNGSDKPYWKCKDCGSSNYSHGSTCNNCGEKNAKQSSRRTAVEGAAPTPGANPHFFDQGTQGLQGPAQFPENPSSGIEPKTDNHVDDLYGAVPPQVSSGSSENQVDGGGYTRQSAKQRFKPGYPHMKVHPPEDFGGFELQDVGWHESPDDHFNVGSWPSSTVDERAAAYGRGYMRAHGHGAVDVPIHHVSERSPYWGKTSASRLGFSRSAASIHDGDFEEGRDHGRAGLGLDEVYSQPSGGYIDGHGTGSSERPSMHPDDRAWIETQVRARHGARHDPEDHPDAAELAQQQQWARNQPRMNPDQEKAWGLDPQSAREQWDASQDALARRAEYARVEQQRQGSTNGQIVGKCDHCAQPVRYHTEKGGHLQHLHNGSPLCSDGRAATAAVVSMDGFQARVRVSPFTTARTAAQDFFRAVPGATGDCEFCGRQASHTLHQVSNGQMHPIAQACHEHAKEYDEQRVASVRRQGAVLENPTAENPTGKGADPYRAKTQWEGFETQRPRQGLEGDGGMNANTPTTSGDPIRTGPNANTPIPGADLDEDGPRERGDQDESDDR